MGTSIFNRHENAGRAGMARRLLTALLAMVLLCGVLTAQAEDKLAPYKTVGSIVTFGRYEQDNQTENGPEAIEWIVLDVEGDKALLLSKYGLEPIQYHKKYVRITWENCTLRSWLNDTFLNTAFTPEEQTAVLLTEVDNSPAQCYGKWTTPSGNNTQDRVFLLSYAEANKYFDATWENGANEKSRAAMTPYAVARHAWTKREFQTEDGQDAGRWWLRSPGRHPNRAAYIYCSGVLRDSHVTSFDRMFGIAVARPAFWIDLNALATIME